MRLDSPENDKARKKFTRQRRESNPRQPELDLLDNDVTKKKFTQRRRGLNPRRSCNFQAHSDENSPGKDSSIQLDSNSNSTRETRSSYEDFVTIEDLGPSENDDNVFPSLINNYKSDAEPIQHNSCTLSASFYNSTDCDNFNAIPIHAHAFTQSDSTEINTISCDDAINNNSVNMSISSCDSYNSDDNINVRYNNNTRKNVAPNCMPNPKKPLTQDLKVAVINARSVLNKIDDLGSQFRDNDIDIAFLSETWKKKQMCKGR